MCGENQGVRLPSAHRQGSPPRVRGKHVAHVAIHDVPGITPACAGKTSVREVVIRQFRDHPRVCGENFEGAEHDAACEGSPPRVRGKPARHCVEAIPRGITPACAGKTIKRVYSRFVRRDHPRVCGENCWEKAQALADWGSPPRVRGKPINPLSSPATVGITPACAGKTQDIKTALNV